MKIYAIVAHDRKDSLTHHLFNFTVECLIKKNNEVDILDLYDRANEIPFYWSDKSKLTAYPFFEENKNRFMKADRLVIVFPIYWYSTPGILKCWIDLITSYAWRYEQGFCARALHSIKKTLVITTSMSPSWYNKYLLGNPVQNQLMHTCKWMGIYRSLFYEIGDTKNLTDKKMEYHKNMIISLCNKLM